MPYDSDPRPPKEKQPGKGQAEPGPAPPPCGSVGDRNLATEPWRNRDATRELRSGYVHRPNTLPRLVEIVLCTEKRKEFVRAMGTSWSFSDVVPPRGGGDAHLIDTSGLSQELGATFLTKTKKDNRTPPGYGSVIPGALIPVNEVLAPGANPILPAYYHIQAGVKIRELNRLLDHEAARGVDWPNRWALHTLGGSGGQSLAGAISTATHGGDFLFPALTDAVRAIHLVGPGGKQYWVEPKLSPITDPWLMEKALPGVELIYDDRWFNAALVSMGCLGIMYSVVLEVFGQFGLKETYDKKTWSQLKAELGNLLGRESPVDYVNVIINPYDGRDRTVGSHHPERGDHECVLITRQRVPLSEAHPPTSMEREDPQKSVDKILHWFKSTLPAWYGLTVLPGTLGIFWLVWVILLLDVAANTHGKSATEVVTWLGNRFPHITPRLISQILGDQFKAPGNWARGVGYEIMDTYPYEEPDKFAPNVHSLEVFYPSLDEGIDGIDRILKTLFDLETQENKFLGGFLAVRFVGRSRALLSMASRGALNCSIEVYGLRDLQESANILDRLELQALRSRGVVHWGQHRGAHPELAAPSKLAGQSAFAGSAFADFLRERYGNNLKAWLDVRAELIRKAGANPYPHPQTCVFDNEFSRRCGLSP